VLRGGGVVFSIAATRQTEAALADVLSRLADHPTNRIAQLLPWNWKQQNQAAMAG
jgi:hypothetical protein